jgi:hypothetical protein
MAGGHDVKFMIAGAEFNIGGEPSGATCPVPSEAARPCRPVADGPSAQSAMSESVIMGS